jgi:hypothetical protein
MNGSLPSLAQRDTVLGETYHAALRAVQAEIAAAGGAGRRSAKNADRPLNQSREALPRGAAAPLPPEGAGVTRRGWRNGQRNA